MAVNSGTDKKSFLRMQKRFFIARIRVFLNFASLSFKRHFPSCCAALLIFKFMIFKDYMVLLLCAIGVTHIFSRCYSYLAKLLHVFYE
ncbi:hypothetical protein F885_01292 [Acinetobacter higginsii]|nr:hypothetical protein F885_01292 [Acinetobacter higginsii]